ncbi:MULTISPECIES: hypothetical protein [Serratia]|nr:hypothetical protein [Serratia marcescens]MDX7566403.1 hypothetical protein [Serratia marcescens]
MEQRNRPEMDVEVMLLEQALRERVDAALSRLRNGTAVYISQSEVEKRMALFKAKIRGAIGEGVEGYLLRVELTVSTGSRSVAVSFERKADVNSMSEMIFCS